MLPALLSALAPALLWLLKKVGDYFKTKAADTAAGGASSRLFDALGQLEIIAENTVAHLNGGVKEKLQTYLADGVLTDAEKEDLKNSAMTTLTSEAGPQVIGLLKSVLGDAFQAVVSGAIEKAVIKANESKIKVAADAGQAAAAKVKNLDDALTVLGAK